SRPTGPRSFRACAVSTGRAPTAPTRQPERATSPARNASCDASRQQGGVQMLDAGLLVLRLVVGALLAGHGAQKMFGWLDGPGLQGAAGMVESLGFRPGRQWAMLASLAELVGGILIVFGFLN